MSYFPVFTVRRTHAHRDVASHIATTLRVAESSHTGIGLDPHVRFGNTELSQHYTASSVMDVGVVSQTAADCFMYIVVGLNGPVAVRYYRTVALKIDVIQS